jgi:hypothetical protein
VAGPVCNELDLSSPCVRSNDIRANIALGGSTGDARLRLRTRTAPMPWTCGRATAT